MVADQLGRDKNEEQTPYEESVAMGILHEPAKRGYHGFFEDEHNIQRYFAELMASGGIVAEAVRRCGLDSYFTVLAWRGKHPEFAEREKVVLQEAKAAKCAVLNDRLVDIGWGEILLPVYEKDGYDLEIPEGLDTDRMTIAEIAHVARPKPRLSGFDSTKPNVPAICKYLSVHDPNWTKAKKESRGDVDRVLDKLVEKLRPVLTAQFSEEGVHITPAQLKSRLEKLLELNVDTESELPS